LSFLIVAAVLVLIQTTHPGEPPNGSFNGSFNGPLNGPAGGVNMMLIFSVVSLALNLILSGSIVLRLLFFRQRIRKDLGAAAGRQYISIAAMLIESAMLYTVVWICFIVPTQLQNPFQFVFISAWVHVQVSSLLTIFYELVLRVVSLTGRLLPLF
jgi:hypothetical protein